jgi:hypothetical protein
VPAKKKTTKKVSSKKLPVASNQQPVTNAEVDAILLHAQQLTNATLAQRDTLFNELAVMIAGVDRVIMREEYINTICTQYKFSKTTFSKLVATHLTPEPIPSPRGEGAGGEAKHPLPATLHEYILFNENPAILWKARKLLTGVTSPIEQSAKLADVCRTIALYPDQVVKDHYLKTIAKEFEQNKKTLEKLVADHTVIETRKTEIVKQVRKNELAKLEGNPKTFPFFIEQFTINKKDNSKTFKGIAIDIQKYLQFLLSFGFMRYGADGQTGKFNFVRIQENIIQEVNIEEIKDFLEDFLEKEYDYDGAGCEEVDSPIIINFFLNNIKKYFQHDLFARLRSRTEIIISADSEKECFLYYSNGFVRITSEGVELLSYDKMNGSVWKKQMLEREFKLADMNVPAAPDGGPDWDETFTNDRPLGDYADFIWRISGQKKPQRFLSLCTILGYLLHDYYDYKLRAIILTDSNISESSEGRTGKTLSMKMLGECRSYCEINGKQFDPADEKKYQYADMSTQIMHINDVQHKGRNKFDLESLFNDITEGYWVRKMFMAPFHKHSKMVISTNKSINVQGASERDRIVEFEMSAFFSEHRSPAQYYGKWMGKGWQQKDWQQFDNFICFCVQAFFVHGLITPETINLEARKLLDGTSREFIEFMGDLTDNLKSTGKPWEGYTFPDRTDFTKVETITDVEFDKNILYDRFVATYPDYKNEKWFSRKKFTLWLKHYAHLQLGIKEPTERRSNGISYIQFKQA